MLLLNAAVSDTASQFDESVEIGDVVQSISTDFHIPRLAVSAIIAVIVIAAAKILSVIIRHSLRRISSRGGKLTPMMASMISRICSVIIWIIAIITVLGAFGIDLTPVLAGLGITGVVLGFALQESISSFFSGIMLAVNNPFRVGDWVDIGDVSGSVVSMDLMCVTLAAGDNRRITLSNTNVWGSTIVNYSFIDKRRLDMTVTVRYSDDLEKAKETIRSLIAGYPEILREPEPLVEVGSYNDSSISIYVRPWVSPSDYWNVYWRFNSDILRTLNTNGLDMPFNQIVVSMAKE